MMTAEKLPELKVETILPSNVTDEHEVEFRNEFGRAIPFADDGSGNLYVYRNEYGVVSMARADSWESAYDAVIDERPTIELSDVPEAYGVFDMFEEWIIENNPHLADSIKTGGSAARKHACEFIYRHMDIFWAIKCDEWQASETWPELLEGYRHQSNSSGTGIVSTGHYERLDKLTDELAKELGLKVIVTGAPEEEE